MTDLLTVSGLEACYGPSQALFGVDLVVAEGSVVALMGRNGMGKTTTIRGICRMTKPSGGAVRFSGRDLAGLASFEVARLGIGLVPEGRRVFAGLTVEENLQAAARSGPWTMQRIETLFPRLAERRRQKAETLSGGEQQMLAIGRALATNPRLLILDEATEGLAPVIRTEIWKAIRALKADGESILVVDKTMAELMPVADHCVILERGRTVWNGPPGAITREVEDRFLGV